MTVNWPVGPEVRVDAVSGGAMLYDTSYPGNVSGEWLSPAWWAGWGRVRETPGGRGASWFIEAEGYHLVLRHYRRGGLAARASVDGYLWLGEDATRSFAEFYLLYHLYHAGLPVPRPVVARYLRRGLVYRADLLVERIPEVRSLAALVGDGPMQRSRWEDVGRCLQRFHHAGCHHADLNAHNVLIDADDKVWLVDFDRGRLRRPGVWCDTNLVRLLRSLQKITDPLPGLHFDAGDWRALTEAYFDARRQRGETGGPAGWQAG
jgi:3-deoxy-D-manno-octulosonic acid kinase